MAQAFDSPKCRICENFIKSGKGQKRNKDTCNEYLVLWGYTFTFTSDPIDSPKFVHDKCLKQLQRGNNPDIKNYNAVVTEANEEIEAMDLEPPKNNNGDNLHLFPTHANNMAGPQGDINEEDIMIDLAPLRLPCY